MMSNLGNSTKQRDIFNRELENLISDRAVSGVLLTGSVACGCASEISDVDIIVLCDRHCFETHFTDGILVETSFMTYEYVVKKLNAEPMDVYHYLDAEIAFDSDGRLSEIMALAKQKYESYHTPQKVMDGLYHWLMTVKIKLETADVLKKRYLAHVNAWKVLEAMWAVNNKPMPPAGTAYRKRGELQTVPCENWFEKLFSEDCCSTMSEIIDFLLPILKKEDVYGMNNLNIKDHINRELSSADREIALDFVDFLEDNKLIFYRDTGGCWKDKIYYWVKSGDKCVCFIAINDPDEKENRWTVWSDDMASEQLEDCTEADEIKEMAWKHIDHCGNCGSCGGGRHRIIFGKEFNDVCGCTFRVDNPDRDELKFLKKMVEIRIKEIQERDFL